MWNEKITVVATTQLEGFHCWPAAPDRRAYLRDRHRHMFHVRAEVEVTGDDREVECHDLIALVRGHWPSCGGELGTTSCEQAARRIAEGLQLDLGKERTVEVTVLEDGEVGARVVIPGRPPA